jgi:hypothetical protein
MKNTERNPTAMYTVMGKMALLYGAEASARRENVMNKRPQSQIKILRTVKRHTKMT